MLGWPPAEIYSSQRQENKPTKTVSRIQDFRKQDSIKNNNNQKVMQVLCQEDVLKSHCCLRKTSKTELSFWQNMESLIQSGSAELCVVMNQDFSCILMLQRGVFKDLVRNTIVNTSLPQITMEEEVSWCGECYVARRNQAQTRDMQNRSRLFSRES